VTDERLVEQSARSWKVRARPERVTAEAAGISGWNAEQWADAVPLRVALEELTALLPAGRTVMPAGQNVRMDVAFLERGYRQCGLAWPFDYHVIDLVTLFYTWSLLSDELPSTFSLRQAATIAGLIDGPVPHRALADARLSLDAFRHFIGRLAPRAADGWRGVPR
jgi:DNA polymerase III epsilon subunit-like protein